MKLFEIESCLSFFFFLVNKKKKKRPDMTNYFLVILVICLYTLLIANEYSLSGKSRHLRLKYVATIH